MRRTAICVALLTLVGCAYIVTKDSQDVSVDSQPKGAKVVVKTSGGVVAFEGETPASVRLKRKNEYVVTVSLEGYKEATVRIGKTINPYIIGNLICGGIPGLVVDGITGAMWQLEPDQIVVTLQVASLNGKDDQLFALISWLDENGQIANIPVELTRE